MKKRWLISLLLVELTALYPLIFTYSQNVAEVDFVEVLPLVVLYSAIGILLWAIFCAATKTPLRSALSTILLLIFMMNYMLIQKVVQLVFPDLKYWHILPIGLLILGHAIYFIFRIKEIFLDKIVPVVSLVMAALILINMLPAVPTIMQKFEADNGRNEQSSPVVATYQPNIYWFIFDECASFPVIKEHYNYTDTTYQDFLTKKGFFISHSSRNESTKTQAILTNCINLNYVVNSSMSIAEISLHHDNPKMYKILAENNYTIRGVGDTEWLGGIKSVTSLNSDSGGQTLEGTGVIEVILQNSVVAPFVTYNGTEDAKLIQDAFDFLQDESNVYPDSSMFTMFYIKAPHQPFLFDADGNSVSAVNYNNWDDPQYYLGQYRYVMSNLTEMVDCILSKDKDCIIIIQSDHGPRTKEGMVFEEKTNVLNAVYYRNEDVSEINGKSSINTFITVFNRLFEMDLKEIPVKDEK